MNHMNIGHSGADVLAPDAKLRAPGRALPRGTVDCHAHIFDRPERCVWATNWPHPGLTQFMPNDTGLLDLLESWLPHNAVREPLFATNAAKLYRFTA
jgi:hypothetical protein